MRSIFGGRLGNVGVDRNGRDRKARSRRLQPSVDGLESRNLMTAVVVPGATLSAGLVTVVPDPGMSSNNTVVSYQTIGGVIDVDVQLNGMNYLFAAAKVGMISYKGSVITDTQTSQTFQNTTGVTTYGCGGSGSNHFIGGYGIDVFVGGSGPNTFDGGKGKDTLIGGSGNNVYNESQTGSGIIIEEGTTLTINVPSNQTGHYNIVI